MELIKCKHCEHKVTKEELEYAEVNMEFPDLPNGDSEPRHSECGCFSDDDDYGCHCNFEKEST
tara:strand:+ start:4687 stop:4875 length:189 start_codon:yes stop_codon:yes gene_type:complete